MAERYFGLISEQDLLDKISDAISIIDPYDKSKYYDKRLLETKFQNDLKVKFDFENWEYGNDNTFNKDLVGIHTFPENNFTFFGMIAGGDWEFPVYFIIYFDGKKLRLYIPSEGNNWNTITKEAYGNNDELDIKSFLIKYPELKDQYKNVDYFETDNLDFDFDLIKKDILNRIKFKDSTVRKPKKINFEDFENILKDNINDFTKLQMKKLIKILVEKY